MHYWVVMPAAGAGRRFGAALPKQHWALAGRTVLELALQPFVDDARCRGIALALDATALADGGLRRRLADKVQAVAGGAERHDSVLAGLEALAPRATDADWVLVHDAARPCLDGADLERLLDAGAAQPLGALLAVPVSDTLKGADADGCAVRTLERRGLWAAQTPQMFRHAPLREALRAARAAGRTPTDEAQALEWQGGRALLVAAAGCNIKITRREDLLLAAAILAARQGRQALQ